MKVIRKLIVNTANRGAATVVISKNESGLFAHELGGPTKWAHLFTSNPKEQEKIAYRVNSMTRYGNQHIRGWKIKPFKTIGDCFTATRHTAAQHITHC